MRSVNRSSGVARCQTSRQRQIGSGRIASRHSLSQPQRHRAHVLPPEGLPTRRDPLRPQCRELPRRSLHRGRRQLLVMSLDPNSGEIAAAGSKDAWDISFMPADPERALLVDQGPAYVAYTSGYLVRAGSDIKSVAEVDRSGIRVGCIEGTGTARAVAKELKRATLIKYPQADSAVELIGRGQLDALAMGMEAVKNISRKLPGTKVLDEVIHSTGVVVVVPKGHAATGTWAAR